MQAIAQNNWVAQPNLTNGYSAFFNVTVNSGIGLTGPSSFNAAGDFTIEGWVNENSITQNLGGGQPRYFNFGASNVAVVSQTDKAIRVDIGGSTFTSATSTVVLGIWRHWAVTRSGTTVNLWYNGVSVASGTVGGTVTMAGAGYIGVYGLGGNSCVSGNISNFRLVVGTAVYTSTFTPPTSPLTAISGTQLLTCQNQTIVDNSSNALTLTGSKNSDIVNPFTATPSPPFIEYQIVGGGGGMGGYMGGGGAGGMLAGILPITAGTSYTTSVGAGGAGSSGSYTQGANGANSTFGSLLTALGGGGGGASGATGGTQSSQGLPGGSGGGGNESSPFSIGWYGGQGALGQGNKGGWGNTDAALYTNGGGGGGAGIAGQNAVLGQPGNGGQGVGSTLVGTPTAYAGGGGGGNDANARGYGVGGAGGGGTGAATASGNTSGTANTGGGAGGGNNNVTITNGGSGIIVISYPDTYGIPTSISGTLTSNTSGFGSMSDYPGGNLVYTTNNSSNFAFGSSNFTIEFWVNNYDLTSGPVMYDGRPSSTNGFYPTIYSDTSGNLFFATNGSAAITGTGALKSNTWAHVAVSRSGTSTKMFVNGIQVGSTYTDTNSYLSSTYTWLMGSSYSLGSNYVNGWMSNIRVNNTTAIYTSTFTPPTSPLTNVSGTVWLLNNMNGSCLLDGSNTGLTMATAGPAYFQSNNPYPVGQGYKKRVYVFSSGSGSITF